MLKEKKKVYDNVKLYNTYIKYIHITKIYDILQV